MRTAFVLHLFYPEVALDLVRRVAALGRADIDLFATYVEPLDSEVAAALDRVPGVVERVEVPNAGWDVAPLFHLLPRLRDGGYELICKLHTKRGSSGYAEEWRTLAYDGTIASEAMVRDVVAAFAADARLDIAGPARLFKSSGGHLFGNATLLASLAPALTAPRYPPADWGFFAGTFFWTRLSLLDRVAAVCEGAADAGEGVRDGAVWHTAERLFGLAPLSGGGRIGLIDADGITVRDVPGEPSDEPLIRTLVDQAERSVATMNADLAALAKAHNPLVHYIRHGRDADALDPNPYFSSDWYNRINEDVAAAGVHPLHHYIHHGWREGRSTQPLSRSGRYTSSHSNGMDDPLIRLMTIGRTDAHGEPLVADTAGSEEIGHTRRRFDLDAERIFLDEMSERPAVAALVSVVMPAYNREATIAAAIRSALAQTHRDIELIVVDDGSGDGTREIVRSFLSDPRVRLIEGAHGGVSAARNLGLAAATGEIVAYLDSDNRWTPWFLEVMLKALSARGAEVGYSAIALRDDRGHLAGYRGAPFDWEECLDQNYVDLNCFVHARALLDKTGGFDTALRRMVDWDLILRLTRDRETVYAPFVGCDYADGKGDRDRVTVSEPAAFEKLVRTKNRHRAAIGTPAFDRALRLSFAIKIAALEKGRRAWGDFHFAESLAEAIRRTGHDARIDFRDDWNRHALRDEDVAIVLRGLIPYTPRPGQIAFLWAISHPDQIGWDEYERYDRVFAASPSHTALLEHVVRVPVETLPQATDPGRFAPEPRATDAPGLLFCGNSRGVERDIVRWAVDAGLEPAIYGGGWEGRVPSRLVVADGIDNRALGPLYAGAGAVLNDHWPSMRAFGIVSNRLFDVAAAGGRAISDAVPGIAALFDGLIEEVDGPEGLARAVDRDGEADRPARLVLAGRIAGEHGFDARARVLVDAALGRLGLGAPPAAPADTRLRVHAIVRHGAHGPQSSAFVRLIAPLTDPSVAGRVRLTVGAPDGPVPRCAVCIVQRAALETTAEVDQLVATLGAMGAALVTDVDDAFVAIGAEHPEAAFYRPLNAALDRAIAASAETWFSTRALAELYGGIAHTPVVIANALDPRLWRDWRAPAPRPFAHEKTRLLYMGTHTHDADLARLRPALDRLDRDLPGSFSLTLVGVAAEAEPARWLDRIAPPRDAIAYPRFVRWLRGIGPFDIGVAPLADTAFNRGKSDVKLLDYAALGLLPVVEDAVAYRADRGTADIAMFARDWEETLRAVLADRDRARRRAEAANAYVWRERAVSGIAPAMLARLEALAGGTR